MVFCVAYLYMCAIMWLDFWWGGFCVKQRNILSGSVFNGILFMAIPIMAMNVFQTLFGIIDMTVLGIMVNDNAVGAVGSSGMLISLTTGLLIGIATGSTVVVARHISKNETEDLNKAIGTSVLFAVISGIMLMIAGFLSARTLLVWINCPIVEEIIRLRICVIHQVKVLRSN